MLKYWSKGDDKGALKTEKTQELLQGQSEDLDSALDKYW